ncbi:uncharacterized protein LOC106143625 [Amyelois transitella]|uniref:uncharacterized protein LOC106143625 n=1 Tax=Amyelois transitella TaxID=680683 RepID=UPI00298FADFD|nr:uncharacterized protein LOC106143625 [Amyelois transitella]
MFFLLASVPVASTPLWRGEPGITKFSDLTQEEYTQRYSCLGPKSTEIRCQRGTVFLSNTSSSYGESFDWRSRNAVTSVKNQGMCNSCYAFSTIGNLEGQVAIKYNKLLDFSVQQLIDCDQTCMGCNNGWMSNAGMYLVNAGGAMLHSTYPYTGRRGQCRFDRSQVVARVTGCRQFPYLQEDQLKTLLETTGPISIAVDSKNFRQYRGGIFYQCGQQIDHAVLLVGYGVENGVPYWTIKNTAGAEFGEAGYIRILRGQNACGIINEQIVSLVVG